MKAIEHFLSFNVPWFENLDDVYTLFRRFIVVCCYHENPGVNPYKHLFHKGLPLCPMAHTFLGMEATLPWVDLNNMALDVGPICWLGMSTVTVAARLRYPYVDNCQECIKALKEIDDETYRPLVEP